jgi:hypothetical protein
MLEAPTPPPPGLYLLYKSVALLQVTLPPGAILVLRRPPTPTFFLYKNPGKFVELPYQKFPFELLPFPKADIYINMIKNNINYNEKLIKIIDLISIII